MKKPQQIEWIPEAQAAAMVGLCKEWFRRCVREGRIQGINYTRPNYKTYLYNKADIEAYLLASSTITA